MASNQFIARKGIISLDDAQITGSLSATGNISSTTLTVTSGITGTATSASYVEYSNVANKPALVSGSSQVSFNGITDKPALVSSSAQIVGYNVFATTGSNQFNGSQAITGSLTVTGQVVAQTLNVQQVTSSIVYSSGSNIFGNSLGNTQQFTGSVSVTGSLTVNGVNYLPLTGGTLTGALSGTSATFSGLVTTNDNLRALQTTTSANSQIIADSDNGSTLRAAIITFGSTASDSLLGILRASNSMLYKDGGKLAIGTRSAQDLVLSTNDTIRLTITSTGTATFSSSVTANSLLVERTVSRNMLGISSTSLPTSGDEEGVAVIKTNSLIWQLSTVGYAADSKGVRFYNNGGTGYTAFEVAQAGGTRFIVNGAGRVGIGTTDPQSNLEVRANDGTAYDATSDNGQDSNGSTITVRNGNTTTESFAQIDMQVSGDEGRAVGRIVTIRKGSATSDMAFVTENANTKAEKMRITSGGVLQMSNNSSTFSIGSIAGQNRIQFESTQFGFYNTSNAYTAIGASAFNVMSDYRLKEDLQEVKGLEKLSALKVYDFKWKSDQSRMDGVLAHELAEVLPYAVHGEKDGEQMQGVDYSKLVPVLVKAIQELKSENDNLKSRLEVLEQS